MRIKKLWWILLLVLIGLTAISLRLNFKYHTTNCNGASTEIWAHRGEHLNLPENSRAAVDQAYASGFTGVELDVFYDQTHGLVVSHDRPYNLINGEIQLLKDVIYGYDGQFRFWLDLKELRTKDIRPIRAALDNLLEKEPGLKERIYIESANGSALRKLNKEFNCIYWVQYQRRGIRGWFKRMSIKFLMSTTDFEGITTDHRYIDESFSRHFKGKCWYVFTVNEEDQIRILQSLPEVEVVLTDLSKKEINAFKRQADI